MTAVVDGAVGERTMSKPFAAYTRRPPLPSFLDQGMSDRERAIRAEGGIRLARRALRRTVEESRRTEDRLRGDLALAHERVDALRAEAAWLRERLGEYVESSRTAAFCSWCGVAAGGVHGAGCRRGGARG